MVLPAGDDVDAQVRAATFRFLATQTQLLGDLLPYSVLKRGFDFHGRRVPLVGPQGIFKPAVLPRFPLTITTSPKTQYNDQIQANGTLLYSYRGTDPQHHENRGVRDAMTHHVPLVYLRGIEEGAYLAAWPVYIIGDDPGRLAFTVDVDGRDIYQEGSSPIADREILRTYREVSVLQRVHQQEFRKRVLRAYKERCALCRLRHRELLDAAHIVPDAAARGDAAVSNALSLCKLHHAAFDQQLIGVRPDYVVEVRADVLTERDGPMLTHGLQSMHLISLVLPANKHEHPDRTRLEERYELFRQAS